MLEYINRQRRNLPQLESMSELYSELFRLTKDDLIIFILKTFNSPVL